MGGYFGAVCREDAIYDVFFGTDYHSHLGTKRGGMAVYGEKGFIGTAVPDRENGVLRVDKTFYL